jgi:hypothetical protein
MQTIIPSTAQVFDIARQANAQHLHIITDGDRTVLSRIVPPGWHKLSVKIKQQKAAA